ncbi:hypothetical protein [Paraburkholderia rhynchosiae]|nr:hypothetical protein [Paraburkholderia rhynchosiae]
MMMDIPVELRVLIMSRQMRKLVEAASESLRSAPLSALLWMP